MEISKNRMNISDLTEIEEGIYQMRLWSAKVLDKIEKEKERLKNGK